MRNFGSGRLFAAAMGLAFVLVPGARSWAVHPGGCCGDGEGAGEAKPAPADAGKGETVEKKKEEPKGALLDLGNTKCPIMGGRPDGKTWSEWKGLRIGHCCPMCSGKFMADPEGMLKKAGIEWKDAAEAAGKLEASKEVDREKVLAAVAKRWKVLRTPAPAKPAPVVVDLANRVCPVTKDEAPDGETWTVWRGVRVGFCCPGCIERFEMAPEKTLDGAGIAWKDAVEAVRVANEATGETRRKALAELTRKWKVVEPKADPAPKKSE